MTKVNPNNGNETKSDIFPCGIFKSDISFIIKKYSSTSMTFRTKICQFYDYSKPKQWKLNKIRHFFFTYSNLTSFFIDCKILQYLNDFYK